jgi:hypothetical protein
VQRRTILIRSVLQIVMSVALLLGAVTGNQVLVLGGAVVVVALLSWEFELRRRRRGT